MELAMATLATNVSFQCLGLDGKPLAGGKVYTYEAGTTTPKSTYTTMAGDVPNLNPVILDQNGKAKIFLGDGAYRMRILDSNDALIDDIDQISRYVTQSEFATFQQTVQDGVNQLAQIQDQIDVFVETAITTQKGYANGIAPLDPNVKIDPIYLPTLINTPLVPKATEAALGVVEIATQTEVNTATDDERVITPLKLLAGVKNHLNVSGNAPMYACRAWTCFNGTSATITPLAGGNVQSITDNGTGDYTVNFTTAMPDENYVVIGTADRDATSTGMFITIESMTVSSVRILSRVGNGGNTDSSFVSLGVLR